MRRARIFTTALVVLLLVGSVLEARIVRVRHRRSHRRRAVRVVRPARRVAVHRRAVRAIRPVLVHRTAAPMIAPAATVVVEGTTYYRFPGVGGTWVTYDGRSVYKHKGYLYIPAGVVGLEIRYTRIPCPN